MLGDCGRVDAPETVRHLGRVQQTDGDRLTVAEGMIAGGLDGVRERVPVIEDGPPAPLALVGRNDVGLDPNTRRDPFVELESVEVAAAQPVVLGQLAEPAPPLIRRQRGEHLGVAQHRRRLPIGTDEVLSLGQVDPGLAPDGGVDLRQQRRGHLHHGKAAVVHRGDEPGDVGDDASADTDHGVGAGQLPPGELPAQVLDRRQGLVGLAATDLEHLVGPARIDGDVEPLLRHDRDSTNSGIEDSGELVTHPGADEDRIRPLAEVDVDSDHRGDSWDSVSGQRSAMAASTTPDVPARSKKPTSTARSATSR